MPATLQWTVTSSEDGFRLDAFLARRLPSFSRRERTTIIAHRQVLLNGRPSPKGTIVHAEDCVTVTAATELSPQPDLPVHIIYADDALVVVNKPAGMSSLALRHNDVETVVNFLIAHFPETKTASPRQLEAGLIHRLDAATSGLLIAARTPHAYTSLRKQFQEHTVKKKYLALVEGHLTTAGQITFPLIAAEEHGQHMQITTAPQGQQALTLYRPLEQLPQHTLVQVTIVTGVRHQIRVHLAAIQHPVVGDSRYGLSTGGVVTRLCLHAKTLTCLHPVTGQRLHFTSPVPEDFALILQQLQPTISGSKKTNQGERRK